MTWKIAYPTPLYFADQSCLGGGERYPVYLAAGVVEATRGAFEVEIISYGDRPRRETIGDGVSLRILKSDRPSDPLEALSWELPEAIEDADLVHIHQIFTRPSMAALVAAKQQGKPVCMTDHGARSPGLGTESVALELADRIISNSAFGGSLLRTTTPVIVVKGGVDTELFTPSPVPLPRDFVLYVGRLLPHKGVDRLIAALPGDLPLVVCGRPSRPDYFRLLQRLASGKSVRFVTDADDTVVRELYRRALVNVLPSVYRDCYGNHYQAPELMGLTLLEAMACGTPAACADVAGMPEFIEDGKTGFIFRDDRELTSVLRSLADDRSLADRLGRTAREVVVAEYDRTVVGARVADVYTSLIASSRIAESEVAA
jgi:glycosyltransferase involved in cell wall biosynthesis